METVSAETLRMETLSVQCFGGLGEFHTDGRIMVQEQLPCRVKVLRERLMQQADSAEAGILRSSAIVQHNAVLGEEDVIRAAEGLCIFPPVNGG